MIFGSVCSGIDAASVAWHPLGWRAAFFAEVDKFPSAVLAHHYPNVQNFGDMTRFKDWPDVSIDVLVGGTPCQSFSVAGLRHGMADPRGNLALTFLGVAYRYQPDWIVWENVPGVLSSLSHEAPDPCPPPPPVDLECEGQEMETEDDYGSEELHALQCFLAGLSELGYGWAYRVLDAQHVRVDGLGRAVPQRRRRVVVVGYLGDWRRAAAVLFERESLHGDTPPRRTQGQGIARPIASSSPRGSGYRNDADTAENLIANTLSAARGADSANAADLETYVPTAFGGNNTDGPIDVATARNAHGGPHGRLDFESETFVAHALRADGFDASEDGTGRGTPIVPIAFDCKAGANTGFAIGDIPGALRGDGHGGGHAAIAFTQNSRSEVRQINGDSCVVGALAVDAGAQQQNYVAFDLRNGTEDTVTQTLQAAGLGDQRGGNPNAMPPGLKW